VLDEVGEPGGGPARGGVANTSAIGTSNTVNAVVGAVGVVSAVGGPGDSSGGGGGGGGSSSGSTSLMASWESVRTRCIAIVPLIAKWSAKEIRDKWQKQLRTRYWPAAAASTEEVAVAVLTANSSTSSTSSGPSVAVPKGKTSPKPKTSVLSPRPASPQATQPMIDEFETAELTIDDIDCLL